MDNDGLIENVLLCKTGVLVYNSNFTEFVFSKTASKISITTKFEKSGNKELKRGFYICGPDQKLMFLSFNKNAQYYIKYILMLICIGFIYFLLHVVILFQTKKLQKENHRLELIVKSRTKQIEEKKVELQNRNLLIEEKQKEILDSIHYAKRIQSALLANKELVKKYFPEHFIYFQPKDIVSGDFYWATEYNDKFYLAVCDSTGHGVPGAFMSLLNIGFLNDAIIEKNLVQPNEILNYVRKRLITSISSEGQKDGMDGILLCYDKINFRVTYASANSVQVLVRNNVLEVLHKDKMPIGKGEKDEDFKLFTIDIIKGDLLYLYTDGYADQFGGDKGKKFKYKPLNELLANISNQPLNEQKIIISKNLDNWKGDLEQVDDICLVGIRL